MKAASAQSTCILVHIGTLSMPTIILGISDLDFYLRIYLIRYRSLNMAKHPKKSVLDNVVFKYFWEKKSN